MRLAIITSILALLASPALAQFPTEENAPFLLQCEHGDGAQVFIEGKIGERRAIAWRGSLSGDVFSVEQRRRIGGVQIFTSTEWDHVVLAIDTETMEAWTPYEPGDDGEALCRIE